MKIIQALEREKQIELCKFKASLVYTQSSVARASQRTCLKVTKGNAEDGSLAIALTTQSIIMSVKRSKVWIHRKPTPYILRRFDSPTIIPTLEGDKITGAS